MERGRSLLCNGKIPKAPKSDGSCPKRYQKLPGCASSTEMSSLTQFLLDPSVGVTVLPFLSLCKGQSLQQVSEHSARTDGYVHASLPSVFREARHAATALLQESQAILDSSFLTTGPDTGNLNEGDLSQEKTLIRRTNSFLD